MKDHLSARRKEIGLVFPLLWETRTKEIYIPACASLHCKGDKMKYPCYEATKASNMEKSSEPKVLHLKPSPLKEPIKAQCSPAEVAKVLFSIKDTSAVHDKENSTGRDHDQSLDESTEDSGYLSQHNSQIHPHHGKEEDDHILGKPAASPPPAAATQQEKTTTPTNSPSKYQARNNYSCQTSLVAVSTPVDCSRRRPAAYCLSSTPSDPHSDPNLPILKFQRAVCEELAKSYKKNKKYDWSIVTKVAEDHLLDRVIGGQMGLDYVDIFTSLLSRNMRSILTNVLALLGEMDLISCKKVSRTWRKIICEDTAALRRCRQAEQALRESRSSLRQKGCSLTRDVAVSRVVLSCMQTLAFSSTPTSSSSSTPSCRTSRRTAAPQKNNNNTTDSQFTRFNEYVQAASSLKQHESLRHCKRCGSPATHSPEVQRAVCTRSSCLFNFCTRCQESFHGSTPCRTVQPRLRAPNSKTSSITPGTRRSIRRL